MSNLIKVSMRSTTALVLALGLLAAQLPYAQAADIPPSGEGSLPGALVLNAETTTMRFTCDDPICDHGHITAYITGAPAKAWVGCSGSTQLAPGIT
jgi:hypothetical protein